MDALFFNPNTENGHSSDSGPKKPLLCERTSFDTFMPIYCSKFQIPFTA